MKQTLKIRDRKSNLKTKTIILLLILSTTFYTGYLFSVYANPVTPTIYLDDLPATATYVVKTDGSGNYWAVRYDGYKFVESTNFTYVMQTVLAGYPALTHIKAGTYYGQIPLPDTSSARSMIIEGEGHLAGGTRIIGNSDCNGQGIFHSFSNAMIAVGGGYKITLQHLRFSFADANEAYGIYGAYIQPSLHHITVDGNMGNTAKGIYLGGTSDNGDPKVLDDVIVHPYSGTGIDTMTAGIQIAGENYFLSSVFVSMEAGELHDVFYFSGTSHAAGMLGLYLGGYLDRQNVTGSVIYVAGGTHVSIDQLMLTETGNHGDWGSIFEVAGATGSLTVNVVHDGFEGNSNLYADATSQHATMILGAFNSVPMEQTYTSVVDGTTKAHGFDYTPQAVIATCSIAGEIVSVIAIDGTNITFGLYWHNGTAVDASHSPATVYVRIRL